MLDGDTVASLRDAIIDRFSAVEFVELLDLDVGQIFDRFIEESLDFDWDEYL